MLLSLPFWQLAPLIEYLPALEARQLRRAATAAIVPHIENKWDRHEFLYQLDTLASELDPPPPPPEPKPPLPYDREEAKAWLEAQGIGVVVIGQVESA